MAIDTTRPRLFIPGPQLQQLPYGLLSVANEITPGDPHAQFGVQYETLSGAVGSLAGIDSTGAQVGTLSPTEDFSTSTPAGALPTIYTNPFLAYAAVQAHPVGHSVEELQARATAKLSLNIGRLIEKALWSGTPSADVNLNGTTSRTVTDGTTATNTTVTSATAAFTSADVGAPISGGSIPANTTIVSVQSATSVTISAAATATASGVSLTIKRINASDLTPTPGTATNIDLGIGVLERWIGSTLGAQGTIHAGRILGGSLWNQVHTAGPRMLTTLGTPVAFGAGYAGDGPNAVAAASGTTWLYATGPVTVVRSEVGHVHVPAPQKTSYATQAVLSTTYATEIVSVAFEGGVSAVLVQLT